MALFQFPKGFLWGAATSAHQVEGGNRNDWTEWEIENAKIKMQNAKLREWPDFILQNYPNPLQEENYVSGRACDHYNRFREDFDIAKQLGHNAHRFSIEWSRIEPEEGKFNEAEIEHYREVIKALRERGMEPFVTIWHWTLPLWVSRRGGWENQRTIADFVRYAGKVVKTIGNEVTFWIPLNEPSIYVGFAYVIGAFPPQVKSYRRSNRVLRNLAEAHRRTYRLIHKISGGRAQVGNAYHLHFNVPYRSHSLIDRVATQFAEYVRDYRPINATQGFQDFLGLNYYFRDHWKFVGWGGKFGPLDIKNPNQDVSDMGWDIAPTGIFHILKKLQRYGLPIYITENGIADETDQKRTQFIRRHLAWTAKAIAEGIDVRGYFYWSLLDNFEWDKGFWPRFGLVEVDYKTLERKIRPSAWEYKKIIEANAIMF